MNFRRVFVSLALLFSTSLFAAPDYITFESGPVRPVALSNNGNELYVLNTPDGYLEVFDLTGELPVHRGSVAVGMDPVALAVHNSGEVWVVNHLSDSVSVVNVNTLSVRRTLLVGDEPRDIVFAGTGGNRAFVTTAYRGQHRSDPSIAAVPGAGEPDYTGSGVARADVWVFEAGNLGATVGGTPLRIIRLFGDTPRALAVSPDGNTVYAAIHFSGNQTTTVHENLVCDGFANTACTLNGQAVPGGNPGPATNFQGTPAPEVGLIVKYNNSNNRWEDELGRNWTDVVKFDLPDLDVFAINANTLAESDNYAHVGTVLYNMAVNPVSGKVYVSNTEALNEVRFEGPGTYVTNTNAKPAGEPATVQGHLHEARITVLDGNQVLPRHLNKHINYNQRPAPASTKQHSLSMPVDMQVSANGTTLYVAAFGSSKIGVFNTTTLENDSFNPTTQSASYISVSGGGPSGVALDEARNRLYVTTRFDNAVSTIDLGSKKELAKYKMFNPEPAQVVDGRPFLYDADFTSSNGEASCGVCHVFGDMDHLAWDLGDPDSTVINNPVTDIKFGNQILPGINGTGNVRDLSPMKGPMTTQTLKGMVNHGAMHWRGDRTGGNDPGGDPNDSNAAFLKFNVAFEGLLGRSGEIPHGDMQKFTDFISEVTLPPNPIRPLNNAFSTLANPARSAFRNQRADGEPAPGIGFTCEGCHQLDAGDGFFGTNGDASFEDETQILKIPHLRNMYQKLGMFGMGRTDFILPGDNVDKGNQVRGFGFLHDGSVDTLFRFFRADVFEQNGNVGFPDNNTRRQTAQFMLEFDNDVAPITGQQITRTNTNGAQVDSRIDLLISEANAFFTSKILGGNASRCDLVVHGVIGGEQRSWRHTQNLNFEGDDGVFINAVTLRNLTNTAGNFLTYTCLPAGSGIRGGVDRDRDNLKNGEDNCPAHANVDQADIDNDGVGNFCDPDFVNVGDMVRVADLNGNNVEEAAALWLADDGSMDVQLNDPQTGALIRQIPFLSKVWAPIEAASMEGLSAGSGSALGVLAKQVSDGLPIIQVKDAADGSLVRNVFPWSAAWNVQDLDVVPGAGTGGQPALAVLATRKADGLMGVELRDPVAGNRIRIVYPLGFGWTAKELAVATVNGQAAVAVLAFRDSDNLAIVQVRNASTGALIRNVFPLGLGWSSQELKVIPDVNGDSVDEIAVRMTRDTDGLELVQIRSAETNALVRNVYPIGAGGAGWTTRSFEPVQEGGSQVLGILSTRDSDGQMLLQLKDATSGAIVRNIFVLGPGWGPVSHLGLEDLGGDGVSEHAVLTVNRVNQRRLVQVRNGATGGVIRNLNQL